MDAISNDEDQRNPSKKISFKNLKRGEQLLTTLILNLLHFLKLFKFDSKKIERPRIGLWSLA
jgi:hypothetical protein